MGGEKKAAVREGRGLRGRERRGRAGAGFILPNRQQVKLTVTRSG